MIKRCNDLFNDGVNLPQIAYPALIFLGVALDCDFAGKAMAVNVFENIIGIFVLKMMGSFEPEVFFNLKYESPGGHAGQTPDCIMLRAIAPI